MKILGLVFTAALVFTACSKKDDDTTASAGTFTVKGAGTADAALTEGETGGDANSLKVAVYSVWVSTKEDCSSPVKVFTLEDGKFESVDFLKNPTLGSGVLANGTYPCVMIGMVDQIKFTAGTGSPAICTEGSEYTLSVCQDGSKSVSPEGVTTNCTDGSDKVWLYLSTLAATAGGQEYTAELCGENYEKCNPFQAPTADAKGNGVKLSGALTVSGSATAKFIVSGKGKIVEETPNGSSTAICGMQPPAFSFKG